MTKTEHYNLPQWEATDRVLMEDFNEAMANIEQAIHTMGETAKTTSACVVDSYLGNGGEISVDLGFRPSFMVILPTNRTTSSTQDIMGVIGTDGMMLATLRYASNGLFTGCRFTETGFTVSASSGMTTDGVTFRYAAFY